MRSKSLKLLSSLSLKSLQGKKVLVRVDFNEPIEGNKLKDGFRIRAARATIDFLLKKGARPIIIAHLEDDNTKLPVPFKKVLPSLEKHFGRSLLLVRDYAKRPIEHAFGIAPKNSCILLENIRLVRGEKENDPNFASLLASVADIYVNDAFSVSHRKHTSIIGITKLLPSYAGLLFEKEIKMLLPVLRPSHPFLLIVGGAKFATKFSLLKTFIPKADGVFLGGVLANTFLKAHDIEIGQSVYESNALSDIKKHFLKSKKIILPFDVRTAHSPKSKSVFEVEKGEMIGDVGMETTLMIASLARDAKYVLWNGPLGFTKGGYSASTRGLLKALAKLKRTKVILGGGDTLEIIDKLKMHDEFYHVSTGGGAMLDYLADGTLPGIEALKKSTKGL